jgi:hypothetical protein
MAGDALRQRTWLGPGRSNSLGAGGDPAWASSPRTCRAAGAVYGRIVMVARFERTVS